MSTKDLLHCPSLRLAPASACAVYRRHTAPGHGAACHCGFLVLTQPADHVAADSKQNGGLELQVLTVDKHLAHAFAMLGQGRSVKPPGTGRRKLYSWTVHIRRVATALQDLPAGVREWNGTHLTSKNQQQRLVIQAITPLSAMEDWWLSLLDALWTAIVLGGAHGKRLAAWPSWPLQTAISQSAVPTLHLFEGCAP